MSEIEQLQKAIAVLEGQRDLLGEAVVEAALAPMREKLWRLEADAAREGRASDKDLDDSRVAHSQEVEPTLTLDESAPRKTDYSIKDNRSATDTLILDKSREPIKQPEASEPRPLGQQRALKEQRKMVTVLFADLAGFTAMSEKMDPEDVREIMNAYFSRWTAILERWGGQVEKFIGDAVMSVFGLAAAREDDPENAIRAALEMRSDLETLNRELQETHQPRLTMRVGIHTGIVVASTLGERYKHGDRGDFVVVGDTVNLASRLQTLAPDNGVLISADTYRHVRGIFNVQEMEPLKVKGKVEPVQALLVLRAKPRSFRTTTRGVEGIETRMIGREADLARLTGTLEAVVEDRELQVVTLVGEAGIGKSRLLLEFYNWLELYSLTVYYFRGRASHSMQNLPYALLRDLFAFRFEIQDSDPPRTVREKMENGIRQAFLREAKKTREEDETARQKGDFATTFSIPGETRVGLMRAHFIGQLLGFDFGDSPYLRGMHEDGRQFRERALAYLRDYFTALTEVNPVVILLEDLHWADDNSLETLNYLAATLDRQRILIVCAARPSLYERRPNWGQEQGLHTRLDLHSLSRRDSRRLVDEILQKVARVPDSLRELVVNNAEGNPFYLEELIKMLIEEGVIVKGDEQWQVHMERLGEVHVPPTLTGVLQARFDSLQPAERVLLQRASVVGRIFWDEAVRFLSTEGNASPREPLQKELDGTLASLNGREMIYKRPQSAFENTCEYLFKHALLRDVTYESVLKRQRRVYHAQAARWLEWVTQRFERADEYAAIIAGHYDQAEDWEQAAAWYQRAGRQAAAQFANEEAVRIFTRALELLPETDRAGRYWLLTARGQVYDILAQREDEASNLEALEALVESLETNPDPALPYGRCKTAFLLNKSMYLSNMADYSQSIQVTQEAIAVAQAHGEKEAEARGHFQWGGTLWRQAEYRQARPILEKALELARAARADHPENNSLITLEAEILRNLGIVIDAFGETDQAIQYFRQSLGLNRKLGNRQGEAKALNSLGIMAYNEEDYATGRRYLEEALRIKLEIGDRHGECSTRINLAVLAYGQKDQPEAKQQMMKALEISLETGDPEGESIAVTGLGAFALYEGDLDASKQYLDRGLAIFSYTGDSQGEGEARRYAGLLALALRQEETALEQTRQALALSEEVGVVEDQVLARLSLGKVYLNLGREAEAQAHFHWAAQAQKMTGQRSRKLEALAGLAHASLAGGDERARRETIDEIWSALAEKTGKIRADHFACLSGVDEPFQIYWICYQSLAACLDELSRSRARQILEAGMDALNQQAASVALPDARRQFLEATPERRMIRAAWEQVQGERLSRA